MSTVQNKLFEYCPHCGRSSPEFRRGHYIICSYCGFQYFHNVATAVGALITVERKLLLLERAQEPQQGKLALPGGFVDPGETLEEALRRECREEVGLILQEEPLLFVASFPNQYFYKRVWYNTCDVFFRIMLSREKVFSLTLDPQEVRSFSWMELDTIPLERLAFESSRKVIAYLQSR
ncbi:MAG: NUDIX domain-containing protein [Treponemataceae bacterium]|nr:NUDIX domain-containing protein [Treponemataceae bacterium]